MKWKNALTYALPVWLVVIAGGCVLALYTYFHVEVGTTEALMRLGIVAGIALPLIAWLIKKLSTISMLSERSGGQIKTGLIAIEATAGADAMTYLTSDFVHAA